jgi:hypothetical protein
MRPSQQAFARTSAHNEAPIDEMRVIFDEEFVIAIADAELRDDEDSAEFASLGAGMLSVYMTEAAPSIQPAAIEMEVRGEIAGVKVRRFIDLLDTRYCGRIIDFKTAARRPAGISAEHALQLTTYAMITPSATGARRLDTVTKTKTVQLVQQTYTAGAEQRKLAENLFPMVQDSIRDGVYLPRRNSPLCSRRHCGYWRKCEHVFSGRVDD